MLRMIRELNRKGVMGVNERNVRFVARSNPRRNLNRVDNKIETKRLADEAGIPQPELYGIVRNGRDMRRLDDILSRPEGCVIKPAHGSQGKGILVIEAPMPGGWRLANGQRISENEIRYHINNILSGMYSLGGQPDSAIIEYRVQFDDAFASVCFKGVPDIRVIVLNGVPAFGMVRLPTAASDGKANLHRGGVGVGLSMVSGMTQGAMQFDRMIADHPDTAQPLAGIVVPQWDDILTMAARAFDVSKLGYVGVDLVLDKERGPLLLELNGRPGLSIQIANQFGLRAHLAEIEGLGAESKSAEVRAGLAKRLFARSFPNMRHRPPSPQTEAPAARDAERDVADAAQDRKVVRLFAEAS